MIIRYHTSRASTTIRAVEADKETPKTITIGGRRRDMRGQWDNYYTTWAEAKEALIIQARKDVKVCSLKLTYAANHLHAVQSIQGVHTRHGVLKHIGAGVSIINDSI